jgi:hypothetical protein
MNVVTIQKIATTTTTILLLLLLLLSSHKIFMSKNENIKSQLGWGCGGWCSFFKL